MKICTYKFTITRSSLLCLFCTLRKQLSMIHKVLWLSCMYMMCPLILCSPALACLLTCRGNPGIATRTSQVSSPVEPLYTKQMIFLKWTGLHLRRLDVFCTHFCKLYEVVWQTYKENIKAILEQFMWLKTKTTSLLTEKCKDLCWMARGILPTGSLVITDLMVVALVQPIATRERKRLDLVSIEEQSLVQRQQCVLLWGS